MTRVVLLVRDGCHLCEEAMAVVSAVCDETGQSWSTRDVDADPELRAAYSDHVPVTLIDGVQHSIWFVDGAVLRAALLAEPA